MEDRDEFIRPELFPDGTSLCRVDRAFSGDFLAELERLDKFLAHRVRDATQVGREDPDVRRLMESLAFFSTRTMQVADQRLRDAIQQLTRGHLDDFVTSQPARAMALAQGRVSL